MENKIFNMTEGGISVCNALLKALDTGYAKENFKSLTGEEARRVFKIILENQKEEFIKMFEN